MRATWLKSTRVLMLGAALGAGALVAALPGVASAKKSSGPEYYLSLGDSYSVGYQPNPSTGGFGGASTGYTGYVATKLKYTLENFGCGGATTASLLSFPEEYCGQDLGGVNNPNSYDPPAATDVGPNVGSDTQVQDAEAFIAANPNEVKLITVSIGGNDVTPCAAASPTNPVNGATDPIDCVAAGTSAISSNVTTAAEDLRGALEAADGATAGAAVPIVGLTYPDVLLGLYVNSGPGGSPPDVPSYPPSSANLTLAGESTEAFSLLINPALKDAYAAAGGKFADVTTATKAYTPLTKLATMNIPALGLGKIKVPKAVEEVCELTWYCEFGNIHANTTGYTDIGKLVVKTAK